MATGDLNNQGEIALEGVVIRAPALRGEVTVKRAVPGTTLRGTDNVSDEVEAALDALGMQTDRTIVIRNPRTVGTAAGSGQRGGGGRAGGLRPQDLEIDVPAPPVGRAQVLLSVDEHGIATWHRPTTTAHAATTVRGGRRMTHYVVPRVVARPTTTGVTVRGLIPGLDQVIRVITFPIVQAAGRAAQSIARSWDREHHPHVIRRRLADGTWSLLDDAAWADIEKGPALLFIHGTFSSTEGSFGRLPADTLTELQRRYDGRVLAFDHPTIADDPTVNAREFFRIVGDRALALDIVCHSRGALVARTIAERPGQLADMSRRVTVANAVLVGATCNGTILASIDHWDELVDRATTLLNLVPNLAVNATLQTILAVVRNLAVEVGHDLEGLNCLAPGSAFLALLNNAAATATTARYVAIVSNFEPSNPGLKEWLNDEVRDSLFDQTPNDMMVAVASMDGANGYPAFPLQTHRDFQPDDGVEHAAYFEQAMTSQALLEWLQPAPQAVGGGH